MCLKEKQSSTEDEPYKFMKNAFSSPAAHFINTIIIAHNRQLRTWSPFVLNKYVNNFHRLPR